MHECPQCKGKGKVIVTVTTYGTDEETKSMQHCPTCFGNGTVSGDLLKAYEFVEKMWCRCKSDHGSYHVPDGADPEITKHHWKCNSCRKVTQVG